MNKEEIRYNFPALNTRVYNKKLVYLDNAATTQRPLSVLNLWEKLSIESNANIHRSVYKTANDATEAYETTRDIVKDFINAQNREEIVFTSGATSAINLVAYSLGEFYFEEGDEILLTRAEHHSNIVPWQLLAKRKKVNIKYIDVDNRGVLDLSNLSELLTEKTKLVALSHISNVLGIINPIEDIIRAAHKINALVLIDGAQGIAHSEVDVQKLGCDFYVFSGHKIYAALGTGVLYGKKELLDIMPPFLSGGEMVDTVTLEGTTFAKPPLKFEAGTQNFISIATLKPAIEFIRKVRECEEKEEFKIRDYMYSNLKKIDGLTLYGDPDNIRDEKINLFSFSITGVHPEDIALILDKLGIAVRSGQMCAEPLMTRFGLTAILRASFAHYNTLEEAEYFIASLNRAVNMLK